MYHVCSFFTYISTFHCFDHNIRGGWEASTIKEIARNERVETKDYIVWQFSNPEQGSAEAIAKMEEFKNILQPGDLIYYTRHHQTGNHAVMWCGDLDGDGVGDILNADGSYYDAGAGVEKREENGGLHMNYRSGSNHDVGYFFGEKAWDYFPKLKDVAVLRYADEKHIENLPLTERAKTRLLFPGLEIYYEVEGGIYGSTVKGSELTYTLTIQNNSDQNHKGIQVQMPVPENAKVVKKDGKDVKNGIVRWTVDVPAGGEVKHTYTVQVTGEVGSTVRSGVGYVHAIPLPDLTTGIASRKLDAAAVKAAIEANKDKTGVDFANGFLDSVGALEEQQDFLTYMVEKKLVPDLPNLQTRLFHKTIYSSKNYQMLLKREQPEVPKEYRVLAKMMINDYFGGKQVETDIFSNRVKELRAEDLEAGDFLVWVPGIYTNSTTPIEIVNDQCMVAIHDGENLLTPVNGQLQALTQENLDSLLACPFFIAFRPTQASNTTPGNPNL